MTKEPKFAVGTPVTLYKRNGSVSAVININDSADIKNQGYRYLVSFPWDELLALPMRFMPEAWSVTEETLFLQNRRRLKNG